MARLSEYNFELCKEICRQVSEGQNIKRVLDSKEEYPSFPTFCAWKREHPELLNLYVNSIADKAEMVDAQIDEIWQEHREGKYEASTANVLIQTLKWKAAKYYPKMYGDKVDLTSAGKAIKQSFMIVPDSIANQMLKDVDNGSVQDSESKK